MGQRRQLREYQLVRLMLMNRQELYAEFVRVMQGEREPGGCTDRDIVYAILDREFPVEEQAQRNQ